MRERTMRKINQREFDALPVVGGRRQCPGDTDYSLITHFSGKCSFGDDCSFGKWCSFGDGCLFGQGCSFGEYCLFGQDCSFGQGCSFGDGCSFGRCSFGEGCSFGAGCLFEGGKRARTTNPYIAIDRAGSVLRKTYFFDLEDGIYVRSGCFFGTLAQFRQRVRDDGGTIKLLQYLGMANIAAITFGRDDLLEA